VIKKKEVILWIISFSWLWLSIWIYRRQYHYFLFDCKCDKFSFRYNEN